MNNPIKALSKREWILWTGSLAIVFISNVATTIYLILAKLNTPNIVFSTISIITSFFATSLTMLRHRII